MNPLPCIVTTVVYMHTEHTYIVAYSLHIYTDIHTPQHQPTQNEHEHLVTSITRTTNNRIPPTRPWPYIRSPSLSIQINVRVRAIANVRRGK